MELVNQPVKEKGIEIKLIVEATNDNIKHLDKQVYYGIKCIDDIGGNIGIFDDVAYMVHIFHKHNVYPDQTFFSNSKTLVEKQSTL